LRLLPGAGFAGFPASRSTLLLDVFGVHNYFSGSFGFEGCLGARLDRPVGESLFNFGGSSAPAVACGASQRLPAGWAVHRAPLIASQHSVRMMARFPTLSVNALIIHVASGVVIVVMLL